MHPRSILIPAVAADEKDDLLLEAYSNKTNEFLGLDKKDRSLITLDLKQKKAAGDNAVNKVRKFLHYRRQNSDWLNRRSLHCDGETEGTSCELGFALALLVQKTLPMGLIATGKLGGIDGLVTIETVTQVPEKLRLVLRKKLAGELKRKRYIFFTPRVYFDVIDKEYYRVADLAEVKQLAALKIDVTPVDSLDDIVKQLNLLPRFSQRFWFSIAAITMLVAVLIDYRLHQLIHLKFENIPDFGDKPFQVYEDKIGKHYDRINEENIVYELPKKAAGKTRLGWKIVLPKEQGFKRLLPQSWQTYYVYAGNIDELGNFKIYDTKIDDKVITFPAGNVWRYSWGLEYQGDKKNLLALLVSRLPLDVNRLEEEFQQRFANTNRPLNFSAVKNYLNTKANGILFFLYETKELKRKCNEQNSNTSSASLCFIK